MPPPDLLVICPSSIEPVNRAVYRWLATEHHVRLHLVLPSRYPVGDGYKVCEPVTDEPFEATILPCRGSNLRTLRLEKLGALIRKLRPRCVLANLDPASVLVCDVLWQKRYGPLRVWALTCENFKRNYLAEALQALLKRRVSTALGRILTLALWMWSRRTLDRVFTISRDGTEAMSALGFQGRVTQIPLGYDTALFHVQPPERRQTVRASLGLTNKTVAYFGRLVPEKGVQILLRSLAKLTDLPWHLLIDQFAAYRSDYVVALQNEIKALNLSDRVVYFDATHTQMPDFMNAADIVVLPSLSSPGVKEQYGRVVPEAMACGKIVIGSSCGTIPELLGDGGYVVPEGDVDALADQLRQVLLASEADLEPVRNRALRRAQTHLSVASQAAIWTDLLSKQESDCPAGLHQSSS